MVLYVASRFFIVLNITSRPFEPWGAFVSLSGIWNQRSRLWKPTYSFWRTEYGVL